MKDVKLLAIFLLVAGSLWAESLWTKGSERSWFSDHKARNVGDLVTVIILESAKARDFSLNKRDKNLEIETEASGALDFLPKIGGKGETKYKRAGATTRSGSIQAKLTAQVVKVMPNGDLMIEGEKRVKIDNQEQTVYVSGIVRPEDIQAGNVILSTYLADARIEYRGGVSLSSAEKPNIGVRILQRLIGWIF